MYIQKCKKKTLGCKTCVWSFCPILTFIRNIYKNMLVLTWNGSTLYIYMFHAIRQIFAFLQKNRKWNFVNRSFFFTFLYIVVISFKSNFSCNDIIPFCVRYIAEDKTISENIWSCILFYINVREYQSMILLLWYNDLKWNTLNIATFSRK
jgi:fucose 4-O-acetylase-like acetyltransferase